MVGQGGSSAGSYLADPTSPIPSHCASIVATSTLRVNADGNADEQSTYEVMQFNDIHVYGRLLSEEHCTHRC